MAKADYATNNQFVNNESRFCCLVQTKKKTTCLTSNDFTFYVLLEIKRSFLRNMHSNRNIIDFKRNGVNLMIIRITKTN